MCSHYRTTQFSILIFTDGAVEDDGLGMGSCAAVLVQPHADEQEVVKMEVFSVLTDSVEAEVCGIGLALDMAIEHYISRESNEKGEKLYVVSDCKATIDIIYRL